MRIQLASDLHLEFLNRCEPERLIIPASGADLLVLAGAVGNGTKGVELKPQGRAGRDC